MMQFPSIQSSMPHLWGCKKSFLASIWLSLTSTKLSSILSLNLQIMVCGLLLWIMGLCETSQAQLLKHYGPLVHVFKNWKLLFKNFCGNTCGWKSVWKYVKCCLKTENCCLETFTKYPLSFCLKLISYIFFFFFEKQNLLVTD